MTKEKEKEILEIKAEYFCRRCRKFYRLDNFDLEKQRCKNCRAEREEEEKIEHLIDTGKIKQ